MNESLLTAALTTVKSLETILMGKTAQIEDALITLFADGHLLLEDLPGMGKTTLAQGIAHCLGLDHQRIQFTSDLLPADILGVSIFEPETGTFRFHEGPVFTQLLLADEINRTSPKTQSALLEVMEERNVTIEGKLYRLAKPFFVIATQNPSTQFGTFPLPESQLDRFLMRISIGYPSPEVERQILAQGDSRLRIDQLPQTLDHSQLLAIQQACMAVHASAEIVDYLQRVLTFTRSSDRFTVGISPRGGLSLLKAAKARAWLKGRTHVLPEDIQKLIGPVFGHRLRTSDQVDELSTERLIDLILDEVDVIR